MGKHSQEVGFNFGLTSAVITTLGLIVGLEAGTRSESAVIGGILIIAIADAFSDALGIHMSEESEGVHTAREVWESTIATFLSKLVFALTFALPFLFVPSIINLQTAVMIDVLWGMTLLSISSYRIAKKSNEKWTHVIGEHLVIATLVIILAHFIGDVVREKFGAVGA